MSTLSMCTICQDEEDLIPLYLNCCKYLYEQLGSDLKEIILIDGGSKDKTVNIILEHLSKLPIIFKQHPFDSFGQQKNRALELATGDFILGLDADMTVSKNFPEVFKNGRFNNFPYWDLLMLFTAHTADQYYHTWGIHYNMRLWKRGPLFGTNFHEKLVGQQGNIRRCDEVFVFEHSCRASDVALLNRGERYQKFVKEMTEAGMGPGPADRYFNAKHGAPYAPIPDYIKNLIIENT